MEVQYFKKDSRQLDRAMEYKRYGTDGTPIIAFSADGGRFYDWEDNGMCDALAPWIESGDIQLFCPDSIDRESWLGQGPERDRIEMQERWFNYLCLELLPEIQKAAGGKKAENSEKPLLCGVGLGALHAVNTCLRRPELFGGVIALDGNYQPDACFENGQDDLVYRNTPLLYLPAFAKTNGWLARVSEVTSFVLCCGRGTGEETAQRSIKTLQPLLDAAGVHAEVDIWGNDVTADWFWWKKEISYFIEKQFGKQG